jgi:hypothetical protein
MAPDSLQGLLLGSDDLQADYEALRATGVQFQGPPQQQPWATEAVLFDPTTTASSSSRSEARTVRAGEECRDGSPARNHSTIRRSVPRGRQEG